MIWGRDFRPDSICVDKYGPPRASKRPDNIKNGVGAERYDLPGNSQGKLDWQIKHVLVHEEREGDTFVICSTASQGIVVNISLNGLAREVIM